MFRGIKSSGLCLELTTKVNRRVLKRLNASVVYPKSFSYKELTSKLRIAENANDNLKQYYEKFWFYPITKYPTEYYKNEEAYLKAKSENKSSLWKTIKYQYSKNKTIFKLFLTNYKNTAWYIINFRFKSSFYNKKMAGYDLDETLKNASFKIIQEENQFTFVEKAKDNRSSVENKSTVVDTMRALVKDPDCVIGSIDSSKFIPYHIDREQHSIIPQFLKITFLVFLLEEMALLLFKFNLVKPPFFAHLPETLLKQIDSENYVLYETVLKESSKSQNYLTPERFQHTKKYKKYHSMITNSYMNFVYLDDLCFIRKLFETSNDDLLVYREELIYKCVERNLFPKNYKTGSYLNLPSATFVNLYTEYLDSRYSQTLMHSVNGIHNIYDLS